MGETIKEKTKEKEFWDWFVKNEKKYHELVVPQDASKDIHLNALISKLNNRIRRAQKGVSALLSAQPDENGVRELIITAEGSLEFFPGVQAIYETAPKLEKWEINAFKQPVNPDVYQHLVIKHPGGTLDTNSVYFLAEESKSREYDILFFCKEPSMERLELIFHLMDMLIGEYNVATKVGGVDIFDIKDMLKATRGREAKKLKELPSLFMN